MIPVPDVAAAWLGSLGWLLLLAVAAFLVTWVATDRLGLRRRPYVGLLALVTAALGLTYASWLGTGTSELLPTHWLPGLLVAPVAGAFLVVGIRRLPAGQRLRGRALVLGVLWEGIVYGVAEGLLLSTLPVLMTWQLVHALDWQEPAGAIARWTLPLVASVLVIVVHHLGYREYRNRLLVPIAVGCGLMSVSYLVTGSVLAPVLAHVLSHLSSIQHGGVLPPHQREELPVAEGRRPVDVTTSAGRR